MVRHSDTIFIHIICLTIHSENSHSCVEDEARITKKDAVDREHEACERSHEQLLTVIILCRVQLGRN